MGAPLRAVDGREHIAMLAIDGQGARIAYRKMWLGTAGAERFKPGSRPAALKVDGWRLGLAICKDTGVPNTLRTRRHARSTCTWLASASQQTRRQSSTSVPGEWPPNITSGSQWPALPARQEEASSPPSVAQRSGGGMGLWSRRRAATLASWSGQHSRKSRSGRYLNRSAAFTIVCP